MRPRLAALLSAAAFVQAQTSTECNPLQKTCPNDKAIPAELFASFSSGIPNGWRRVPCKGPLTFGPGGATIGYKEAEDCTSVETVGMALFGNFEVKMKAAAGKGIVSSIVLQSDVLDEIDWEFLGSEDYRVQSNYFGKGDTSTYDRMIYVPIANNQAEYHTYGINWTAAAVTWTIDGAPVRTLKYADAKGGSRFPQTPARLKIGIWAAPTDAPGVIEWAGGQADLSKGPYAMTLSQVNIVNHSPGKEYRYKDRTGNWDSIEVIPGVPDAPEPTPSTTMTMPHDSMPPGSGTNVGGNSPPFPAFTSAVSPGNASTVATAPAASPTKAANATVLIPTASASASKPASGNSATSSSGATSAAMAGLSLLFLALLA